MAELQAQLIAAKKSTPSVDVVSIAKRPRLQGPNAKGEIYWGYHRSLSKSFVLLNPDF